MTIIENQLVVMKNNFTKMKKMSIKPQKCPVTFTLSKIGGKWKPIILYLISQSSEQRVSNRFGVMHRRIEGISKQMLTKQLRELEADGIIERKIFAEIPPRVEYYLTDLGHSLMPIIGSMRAWGERNMDAVAS